MSATQNMCMIKWFNRLLLKTPDTERQIRFGMPGMGGHKCLRELLRMDPAIKVIIASGYSVNEQVRRSLEAGAVGYVGKPYQLSELLEISRDVLDREE